MSNQSTRVELCLLHVLPLPFFSLILRIISNIWKVASCDCCGSFQHLTRSSDGPSPMGISGPSPHFHSTQHAVPLITTTAPPLHHNKRRQPGLVACTHHHKWRQKDEEFEASLGYIAKLFTKKKKNHTDKKSWCHAEFFSPSFLFLCQFKQDCFDWNMCSFSSRSSLSFFPVLSVMKCRSFVF